jgi:TldD protein
MGFELFAQRVNPEETGRTAAQSASLMLNAPMCPAGVMPVVIDGGFGGVIFHEACGHSLEATAVAFNLSVFTGKLNQKIAADCVTAVDDGTIPHEWGSTRIDDEGMPTTRLTLIENGILKNYMIDKLNGKRMGMAPTGSGRRQNYSYTPTSRMRNTFIAPRGDDEEEMIKTMGDGLYAKKMGGGSVVPATGEFNFAVAEGYLVKDGKIATPVRGASLIGKTMTMSQGMCGSSSGNVPTNVGQPMIRVKQMTVGGRAKE